MYNFEVSMSVCEKENCKISETNLENDGKISFFFLLPIWFSKPLQFNKENILFFSLVVEYNLAVLIIVIFIFLSIGVMGIGT